MKKISLFAVLLLLASVTGLAQKASAQIDSSNDTCSYFDVLLSKLSQRDDVTVVTITKSLLGIMTATDSYPDIVGSYEGINVQNIVAKLNHIDIVTSKSDEAKKIMRAINKEIDMGRDGKTEMLMKKTEVLMRMKNEKNNIVLYAKKDVKTNDITSLVLFSESKIDQEKSVLIRLTGIFNSDDIKQIIKEKKEKKN
jgi:hypothetical protein